MASNPATSSTTTAPQQSPPDADDPAATGGAAAPDTAPADGSADGSEAPAVDVATLQAQLAQVRREAAASRKRAAALEAENKTFRDAQLTEQQKIEQRQAELERAAAEAASRLRDVQGRAAVIESAARLGAPKPSLVHRLVAGDLEFDDDGVPTNADEIVTAFLKENPEFGKPAPAAPAGPSGSVDGGAQGAATLTLEQIAKMTPAQVDANWPAVEKALQAQR